jgi:hypothetical protein
MIQALRRHAELKLCGASPETATRSTAPWRNVALGTPNRPRRDPHVLDLTTLGAPHDVTLAVATLYPADDYSRPLLAT